jgi:hypothetical protein
VLFDSNSINAEPVFVPLRSGFIVTGIKEQVAIAEIVLGIIASSRICCMNTDIEEGIVICQIDIGMN